MNAPRLPCALLLALVLAPASAAAQWNIEVEPVAESQPDERVAVGTNPEGDRLRIRRREDDIIEAVFSLRSGLAPLADGCPSYQVDAQPPRALVVDTGFCRPDGRSVTFSLGRLNDRQIDSEALQELMNGSRIRFIFHLEGLGYEEATLSLSGSKQAIVEVLGSNVEVNGD